MSVHGGQLFLALVDSFTMGLVSAKFFPSLQRLGSGCHTMADEPRRGCTRSFVLTRSSAQRAEVLKSNI